MMKYTTSFEEEEQEDDGVGALPPMRPCSTATRGHRNGAVKKAAMRRVSFDDVVAVERQSSLGGGGVDRTFITIGDARGDDATHASSYFEAGDGDDDTIHSHTLYSLHNYSPAAKKRKQQEKEGERSTAHRFCLAFEDWLGEEGLVEDISSSLLQVVTALPNALAISDEDIDGMSDTMRQSITKLGKMEHERKVRRWRKMEMKNDWTNAALSRQASF
ncbi:hypothetical protein ACHAXT_006114 [Thalassiosira profunda]